jgi:hypothetical protein
MKRKTLATILSHTICLMAGIRLGNGAAAQTMKGTLCMSMSISAFPKILNAWQQMGLTSFSLRTADVLDISTVLPDALECELIVQYREK